MASFVDWLSGWFLYHGKTIPECHPKGKKVEEYTPECNPITQHETESNIISLSRTIFVSSCCVDTRNVREILCHLPAKFQPVHWKMWTQLQSHNAWPFDYSQIRQHNQCYFKHDKMTERQPRAIIDSVCILLENGNKVTRSNNIEIWRLMGLQKPTYNSHPKLKWTDLVTIQDVPKR